MTLSKSFMREGSSAVSDKFPLQKLGFLADADKCHEPLELGRVESTELFEYLRLMSLIRFAEEKIGNAYVARQVRCPIHLGIGQEAVAVGVSAGLRKTDRIFGAHRSHAHFLALGAPVQSLFAEVLGRQTGASRGLGGSMHLCAPAYGFMGCVPIVGATIPIAVGAALAAKMDGKGAVGVVYFGDGATEEGVLHESLNLAAAMQLPVFFVAENNFFSSHLHIDERQPSNCLSRFAQANGIRHEVVDGDDVVATAVASAHLLEICRTDQPVFLEAVTYRWRGHVGPSEDQDVGVSRKSDLAQWKKRDPIARLAKALCSAGYCTEHDVAELHASVATQVEEAWDAALQDELTDPSLTLGAVYSDKSRGGR